MCSMKWLMPVSPERSQRLPTADQMPRLTLAMCGNSAVANRSPLGNRVI